MTGACLFGIWVIASGFVAWLYAEPKPKPEPEPKSFPKRDPGDAKGAIDFADLEFVTAQISLAEFNAMFRAYLEASSH